MHSFAKENAFASRSKVDSGESGPAKFLRSLGEFQLFMKRASGIAFVVFLAASLAPSLRAQSAAEKVNVNLVLIDARVTDARGNQILGLDKDDFIVKENGAAQSIDSVDYFTNRRLLSSPEGNAPFKVERVHEDRDFIFFFDREAVTGFNPTGELMQARVAAQRYVDEDMKANDRIAVVSYDARLRVFSDFTSDKRLLRKALDEVTSFGRGIVSRDKSPEGTIFARLDAHEMMDHTGRVQDAVRVLADAVKTIPRRKTMVFFTSGMENESTYVDAMMRALSRANVTVDVVMLQGHRHVPELEQALTRMTSGTGGQYFPDTVNYLTPLREIEKSETGYYLLSYYTRRDPEKHGFQRVDVSLRNPEFRVEARPGYEY